MLQASADERLVVIEVLLPKMLFGTVAHFATGPETECVRSQEFGVEACIGDRAGLQFDFGSVDGLFPGYGLNEHLLRKLIKERGKLACRFAALVLADRFRIHRCRKLLAILPS